MIWSAKKYTECNRIFSNTLSAQISFSFIHQNKTKIEWIKKKKYQVCILPSYFMFCSIRFNSFVLCVILCTDETTTETSTVYKIHYFEFVCQRRSEQRARHVHYYYCHAYIFYCYLLFCRCCCRLFFFFLSSISYCYRCRWIVSYIILILRYK